MGGLCTASAHAQEPTVFRLDPVFVSVFRSENEALQARARQVEERLVQAISDRHLVVSLSEVPAFEDYSAEVYLLSCPIEQDPGCAYVIADRASADWAVSGVLSLTPGGDTMLKTTLVDVRGARAVVQFDVPVDEGDSASYATAVAELLDQLASEPAVEPDPDVPVSTGPSDAERAAIAASLGQLESELGELKIRDRDRAMDAPKLRDDDIAAFQDRETGPPWVRMGLTADQYRRMRNGGHTLEAWRARLRGRAGRVLVRGVLGGGRGPFGVSVDGRWVIDPAVGDVVRREVFQEVVPGGSFGGGVEVSVGLLPWLDVGAAFQSSAGSLTYLLHPETLGDARVPADPTTTPGGAVYLGGIATVAALPAADVRPTGSVGLGVWFGPGLAQAIDASSVPTIDIPGAPQVVLARLGPGVEFDASRQVQLFARVELVLPISGQELVQSASGPQELEYPGLPRGTAGLGAGAAVGVQASFGPLWSGATRRGPLSLDDEEPEDSVP